MRTTRVGIDPVNHTHVFDAEVSDQRWNGWMCPTFDYETALKVIAWLEGNDGQEDYHKFFWTTDRDGQRILMQGDSCGDDDWYWDFYEERNGYSIGSWSWTWQEIEEEAPRDPVMLDAYLKVQMEHTRVYCVTWNTALRAAYAAGASSTEAIATAQTAVDEMNAVQAS